MDSLLTSRESLSLALGQRGVVPVIGPEMLEVEVDDGAGRRRGVPFYRLVAEELLRTYGCSPAEPPAGARGGGWPLHQAVAQVLAERRESSTERLRRCVSATIKRLAAQVRATPLLDRLARLDAFDLYVCLTPDDLLVEALRRLPGREVDIGAFAPTADSSQPVDVLPRAGAVRVFFPLGRSAPGHHLAIHEEDALEYFYQFQEYGPRRAPSLLAELRSRDLLLLGCNLPDWLGRAFLRVANEKRLSWPEKKMEFFAADTQDALLNSFLARFNPNACVFPWSPQEFIGELEALGAGVARPPAGSAPALAAAAAATAATAVAGVRQPTVFLSYASEDREAARRLTDALLQAGFGDVWFDQHKLVAGDDWSDRIEEAIEHCDFFMPVLSHQADRRREGVFWEEWRKAVVRAMRVNDSFVLPVGIDDTAPDRSGYERIFSGFTCDFRRIHLLHAPQGRLPAEGLQALRERSERFAQACHD